MSDDREKKSWREIDLARDRGLGTKSPKSLSKAEERAQKLASKSAIKELEQLFKGSKISKEKTSRLTEIQSLRGRPEFYSKLTEYYQEFGSPLEWEAQILFLDHRDSKIVLAILKELEKTAPREELSRQDLLGQKLKVMELSTFDSELLDQISAVKKAILAKS